MLTSLGAMIVSAFLGHVLARFLRAAKHDLKLPRIRTVRVIRERLDLAVSVSVDGDCCLDLQRALPLIDLIRRYHTLRQRVNTFRHISTMCEKSLRGAEKCLYFI
jgi:hypothetical protein